MQSMSAQPHFSLASHFYQNLLTLYPRSFQKRFGAEIHEVFLEALSEQSAHGRMQAFLFLCREIIEAPASILNQHLAANSRWVRPYPMNLLAFTLGFTLIGFNDAANSIQSGSGIQGSQTFLFQLICFLLVGGLGGLAIGSSINPIRKRFFVLSGAVGFAAANLFALFILNTYFPEAFATSESGFAFLIPFIYPILAGSIFGLFIGIITQKWQSTLCCIGMSMLALFAGYFVNRLSSALMQSYVFPGPLNGLSNPFNMLVYYLVPNMIEGIMLGIVFGSLAQHNRFIPSTP